MSKKEEYRQKNELFLTELAKQEGVFMIQKGIKYVVVALCMLCAPATAGAQQTMAETFENMPLDKTPYITLNDKREMIECWNQKLDTSVKNKFDGTSSIDTLGVDYAMIKLSEAKHLTLFALNSEKEGSAVGLITTLYTPKPQSELEIYTKDWQLLYSADRLNLKETDFLQKPDTMTKEKYNELVAMIANPNLNFEYNPQTKEMSVTLSADVLSTEEKQQIKGLISKQLLIWDGKMLKNK